MSELRSRAIRVLACAVALADALGDMRRVGASTFRYSYRSIIEAYVEAQS